MCIPPIIPFLTELTLVTKSGSFMIIVIYLVNKLYVMSPQIFPNSKVAPAKNYSDSFVVCNQCYPLQFFGNKSVHYCNQLAEMHVSLQKILLHENAMPHVAKLILQKLTDFTQPLYSIDLSPTDYV